MAVRRSVPVQQRLDRRIHVAGISQVVETDDARGELGERCAGALSPRCGGGGAGDGCALIRL